MAMPLVCCVDLKPFKGCEGLFEKTGSGYSMYSLFFAPETIPSPMKNLSCSLTKRRDSNDHYGKTAIKTGASRACGIGAGV